MVRMGLESRIWPALSPGRRCQWCVILLLVYFLSSLEDTQLIMTPIGETLMQWESEVANNPSTPRETSDVPDMSTLTLREPPSPDGGDPAST